MDGGNMRVLVVGSTGKTGFQVVKQLLLNDFQVKALARRTDKFREIPQKENLEVIVESIMDIRDERMKEILSDTDAVISCLGHNLSFKGVFGKPHYLVTDSIKKIVQNIPDPSKTKVILMNTVACLKGGSSEKFSFRENLVISLLRVILPPQRDNEKALQFLEKNIQPGNSPEWVALRPDALTDEEEVTEYTLFASTQRSPIFDSGKTSRINTAHFMMDLLAKEELWNTWKYKAPVVYNKE